MNKDNVSWTAREDPGSLRFWMEVNGAISSVKLNKICSAEGLTSAKGLTWLSFTASSLEVEYVNLSNRLHHYYILLEFCNSKQLLDEVFVISRIIKVEVRVISRS